MDPPPPGIRGLTLIWAVVSSFPILSRGNRTGFPGEISKGDDHPAHCQNFVDWRETDRFDRDRPLGIPPCHLADIAMRTRRALQWDNDKEQIIGDDEANKLVMREYRAPWELPMI